MVKRLGIWLILGCLSLFMVSYADSVIIPKGESKNCQRIVSVSPALSDMMVDLKLDGNIVGATRYCRLPPSAIRQDVGGFFDLNFEKVVSLKPDIVFIEGSIDNPVSKRLDSLGIKNRVFSLDTLSEMEAAQQEIGLYCEGEIVIDELTLKDHLAEFIPKPHSAHKPKVLLLYNYGDNVETILPRLAAGRSFHGELLSTIGMENVYLGSLNAPELSREAISLLNPEWIFILNGMIENPDVDRDYLDVEKISPKWEFLSSVKAIQNGQVYEIKGFHTQIPSVAAMKHLAEIMSGLAYGERKPSLSAQ